MIGTRTKVGILTFHRALNYGAALQAYALQHYLSRLGADSDILDYRCQVIEKSYRVFSANEHSVRAVVSGLAHVPERVARRRLFSEFRGKHLTVSAQPYLSRTIHQANERYDTFIVGSDQVWNPELTGDDDTYYLAFCKREGGKIAYAASLGVGVVDDSDAVVYRERLGDFHAVSVRERSIRDQLAEVLDRDVAWVVDPCLLLTADEWSLLAQGPRGSTPYIFAYCLHDVGVYRYAEHLRKLTGLRIVYVTDSLRAPVKGERVAAPTVEAFIGFIQRARFVVTDSYHVTVFAIIFGRDFKVQMKRALRGLNARAESLLVMLGLEDRTVRDSDYADDLPPALNSERVSASLSAGIRTSTEYLASALGIDTERVHEA